MGFSESGATKPGLINAGCYVLIKQQLDNFKLGAPFSFEKDFLCDESELKKFHVFESKGFFIDIGVPRDYARAQTLLKQW